MEIGKTNYIERIPDCIMCPNSTAHEACHFVSEETKNFKFRLICVAGSDNCRVSIFKALCVPILYYVSCSWFGSGRSRTL